MQKIEIENEEVLNNLKPFEWFVNQTVCDLIIRDEKSFSCNRNDYVSIPYMQKIMRMGKDHNGFPERVKGYSFNGVGLKFKNASDPLVSEMMNRYNENIFNFSSSQMLRHNALFTVYPPGGFISWHNNANASAYNFIFTWSETGNGYWQNYDMEEQKVVTINDKPGWQCKSGYFGSYNENPNKIVYHSASTDCWRMTVAFVLDRSEMSKGIQDLIIEELSFTE